ncbi:type I methionyl aminopeptidase [Leucobacter chromiireducens]|uniref:Methionine aminopeptidase n=1 Tax=Leucobacter chromiireducens subsp. solipictus TaxID=398235 RepID=A0ABS1SGF2_9MICO|nr:type I methionyl aminopeptidase [Leucobacter chromiireducens]MBL3679402.1 type I methionyl aminopeptidase [Leucobacter chromiireducens subsp. solipictus]
MPFDAHGNLIPGSRPSPLTVPAHIARPPYVGLQVPPAYTGNNTYTEAEIELIRTAGRIASQALDAVGAAVAPGVTTAELDRVAHDVVVAAGAYPSTLGYRGYPASSCTSVNEVICHGIPDDTVLREGDIVNVDVTAYLDGFHGDTNRTFRVGQVSEEVDLLIERTHEAMMRGIKAAKPGRAVNVIGRVIETYAKRFGYGVVRDFTGHGVGSSFHTGLIIPHYDSAPSYGDLIVPGMVFTVEPMLTLGTHEWEQWDDGWTVTTRDKSVTAQFEHTIVVREDGFELLTVSE